jgi:hypothetical protein
MKKETIKEYLEQIEIDNMYCFERYIDLILKTSLNDKIYIDYYWYIWNALDRWYISDQCFDNLNKNWPKIINSILDYKRPGEAGRPKNYIVKIVSSEVICNII